MKNDFELFEAKVRDLPQFLSMPIPETYDLRDLYDLDYSVETAGAMIHRELVWRAQQGWDSEAARYDAWFTELQMKAEHLGVYAERDSQSVRRAWKSGLTPNQATKELYRGQRLTKVSESNLEMLRRRPSPEPATERPLREKPMQAAQQQMKASQPQPTQSCQGQSTIGRTTWTDLPERTQQPKQRLTGAQLRNIAGCLVVDLANEGRMELSDDSVNAVYENLLSYFEMS